ncbi:MAG: acyl-CoA synthetase [Hyphomicrobiales bacterium]
MSRADYEAFPKTKANYEPLTPLSFLVRTKDIYPHRTSVVYGKRRFTWGETYERCVRLASALHNHGIAIGDTVSVMALNTPEIFEAHYGVNMAGAVLNTINVRLDADTVGYILEFGEAKVIITDTQFSDTVKEALKLSGRDDILVIDIVDEEVESLPQGGERLGAMTYEEFLDSGEPAFDWKMPEDEWQSMALNFTSGSTGRPKGVVYHHRGAYMIATSTAMGWPVQKHPVYMYIVPMFHCNGWGHAWTMTAMAGTIICCRNVVAKDMYDLIAEHKVTHFGGAPIVLSFLINAKDDEKRAFDHEVNVYTAGAPPPAVVLEAAGKIGFNVTHVYGLTETYGHVTECAWQDEWADLSSQERAGIQSRQGVAVQNMEPITVLDPETGEPVPHDGETIGEIAMRGNCVMKGYYKNPEATDEAFKDGYFHSGDLAVIHPTKYIQIKDRLKDIIISGGENISSVEVEATLARHPKVMLAAVVAKPDEKWGETPAAFLELKPGETVSEAEIIAFCREYLAGFKCPKSVYFQELPKTATGKIQKFELRKKLTA